MLNADANPDERHHQGLRALDVLTSGGSIDVCTLSISRVDPSGVAGDPGQKGEV